MLRIALLKSGSNHPGGLETYTQALIAHLLKIPQVKLTYLTSGTPPPLCDRVDVFSVASHSKWSYQHLKHFDQGVQTFLQKTPQDLVLGLDRNAFQTHYRAGNGVHRAYLAARAQHEAAWKSWTFPFNPHHRQIIRLEQQTFEHPKTQKIFTNSHKVRQEILAYYRVDPEKIHVIYNGTHIPSHIPHTSDPSAPHQFLFVGHGWARKGLRPLLEALTSVPKGSYHLHIVGHDRHATRYQHFVQKRHLTPYVTFHGAQTHLSPYYFRADTLVVPSIYDPFANVTLEGLAHGLRVITTQTNGASEIVLPQYGAIIDSAHDMDALSHALTTISSQKTSHPTRLAIQNSVRSLSFDNQVCKLLEKVLEDAP